MYGKVVKNGPYSDVAPEAQLKIGTAHEKQKTLGFKSPDYAAAAKAYETAADRYHDRPKVAAEALFREGLAHQKQAQTAEYDQSTAGQAIAKFYEKYKRWKGAVVYYNEVVLQDPESSYAAQAKVRIDELKKRALATPIDK
jgi:outer membrane protein assembly factor BamD (BamD/ComL family)